MVLNVRLTPSAGEKKQEDFGRSLVEKGEGQLEKATNRTRTTFVCGSGNGRNDVFGSRWSVGLA